MQITQPTIQGKVWFNRIVNLDNEAILEDHVENGMIFEIMSARRCNFAAKSQATQTVPGMPLEMAIASSLAPIARDQTSKPFHFQTKDQ
jgi:hypothetical protein